jgi:hypothetical protein
MARFSVTEAATVGFGIIGRKPLVVVGWAVALVAALVLPALLCIATLGPRFVEIMQLAAQQKGQTGDPEALDRMMRLNSGLTGFNMLYWLWSTFVKSVFCAAVFRAVMTPEKSAWAYLRIGSREMWLALVLLVEQVLLGIAVFVMALVIGVVAAIAAVGAGHNQAGGAIAVASVGGAIAAVLVIWVALRLSMAGPMSFADNQFRLFESWDLTKGQAWRLLCVALLVILFLVVMEMLLAGLIIGVVLAGGGSLAALHGGASVDALFRRPPAEILRALWPWLTSLGVVVALFAAVAQAVFYAPWAFIHRALTRPREAAWL